MLFAMLAIGFSLIWLLPNQKEMEPSRLSHNLPENFDEWKSIAREVSPQERKILAEDTEFARRFYYDPAYSGWHGFEVSVVFSGKDINNSLHRPEVCLIAQGWKFTGERYISLKGVMPDGSDLPVKEIVCVRPRVAAEGEEVDRAKNGEPVYDKRIQYYTFIGSHSIVAGHYERTWQDIKDRILGGYDQQWAYATFSTMVTSAYEEQGVWDGSVAARDEEDTRSALTEFISELLPQIIDQAKQAKPSGL